MANPARAAKSGPKKTYVNRPSKGKKVSVVEDALEEIWSQHGTVTQKLVVDWARPPSSPLHKYFEWDDKIAGEKYRENQALQMIIASRFVLLLNQPNAPPPLIANGTSVRKLLPALNGEGFKMRYEILEEKDTRAEFVALKKKQLQTWCRETSDIEELALLRAEILKLL